MVWGYKNGVHAKISVLYFCTHFSHLVFKCWFEFENWRSFKIKFMDDFGQCVCLDSICVLRLYPCFSAVSVCFGSSICLSCICFWGISVFATLCLFNVTASKAYDHMTTVLAMCATCQQLCWLFEGPYDHLIKAYILAIYTCSYCQLTCWVCVSITIPCNHTFVHVWRLLTDLLSMWLSL